jgi:hypothetical protein
VTFASEFFRKERKEDENCKQVGFSYCVNPAWLYRITLGSCPRHVLLRYQPVIALPLQCYCRVPALTSRAPTHAFPFREHVRWQLTTGLLQVGKCHSIDAVCTIYCIVYTVPQAQGAALEEI